MPAIVHTDVETSLLSVLQGSLNGDTSLLIPPAEIFYDPTNSDAANFRYDGFVTKRGTLSVASQASGAILTLSSATDAAQFRAGDVCFLVGNAYAGALAGNNTADQVTVLSVSPANQTVTVTGRAASLYSIGASLVVVSASAPGAVVNSASTGASVGNEKLAALLTAFESHCSSTIIEDSSGSTTTNFVCLNPGGFTELPSLIGATVTILTDPGTPANIGCSATVVGATGAAPVTLALDNFLDANGDSIAAWPGVPTNADTASLQLDLSEGKLASLGVAGGDMSTMVTTLLTMHRKLDSGIAPPEIPLINEWNVWGQATGTMLRMSAGYIDGGGGATPTLTLEWNDAAGDLPFPLTGRVRVINAQDGVGGTAWGAPSTGTPGYVAYTRQKNSNVLTVGAGALGANYPIGCIAMLDPAINGFAKTSGVAPEVNSNYLSGLLWQLTSAVIAFAILGT